MPFQKGHKKIAGRAKGTPNKRKTFFESLETITYDGEPVDIVQLFFKGLMTMPPYQQVDALLELMKYAYPQQKNMQISQPEGEGFKIVIEDYTKK